MSRLSTERAVDRAVEAQINGEPWAVKVKKALDDDGREQVRRKVHLKQLAAREHEELTMQQVRPSKDDAITTDGPLLKRAMTDPDVEWALAPKALAVFRVMCAYADAGTYSPQMKALAARTALTLPMLMFLLYKLELRGWLSIEWAPQGQRNQYTVLWPIDATKADA